MTLLSRIVEKWAGLPPAVTHDVAVERDLRIPMPDGVTLLADRYAPRGVANPPLLLVRSPYGRRLFFGFLYGRLYAERGFQVVVQSCRGTFGSGEVPFVPNFHERADGLATVEWLRAQPWYPGRFGTVGPSYLGFVQWAIASARLPDHVAMAIQMAPHEFQSVTHPDGSFALETTLGWARMVNGQSERGLLANLRHMRREKRELAPAFAEVPLATSYLRATQSRVAFFEDWLAHEAPDDPWWKPIDFAAALPEIETPVLLVGGWFDLFARHTIAQWSGLAAGGRAPRMLIGPWQHMDLTMRWAAIFQESLAFLRSELCGEARPEKCVRLFVMGADEWREYPSWPPPGTREQRLYLHDGGALGDGPPAAAGVDHYRYDPADPTPSVGGTSLGATAGRKDNRALEARADVLTYTTAPLASAVEAVGPVRAELFVASSLAHTDFFARLCDVDPSGKSTNLCDGIVRLRPGRVAAQPDGTIALAIDCWATAHRFRPGHRIRLQVSSGAHPRFARNTGSGEPLATAARLVAAEQRVHRGPDHPSALVLPVVG